MLSWLNFSVGSVDPVADMLLGLDLVLARCLARGAGLVSMIRVDVAVGRSAFGLGWLLDQSLPAST